ncbi:MAG: futalosine hydrolase [Flavobacteriales bacterium]|nr:futalosine hydrolase [Flavobacteriales bacterium]
MNILILAATYNEVFSKEFNDCEILISGVGIPNACYALTNHLQENKPDLIINMGVAGSFNREYLVGDVFEVAKDSFSEIGAENGEGFLSAKDIGLDITTSFDYVPKTSLNQAQGITVNTIHGNNDSIKEVMSRLRPDLESMEGAAFMMICQRFNINFIQVRSVSNFVEERNKDNWNLDLAIKNLNHTVRMIINDL